MKTFLSRLPRWWRKIMRRPHFFTDLMTRYDNWTRSKEYL